MKEIFIYGQVVESQASVDDYGAVNLKAVNEQLKSVEGEDEILVRIHSEGGSVDEGFAIYSALRRASKNQKVVTRIDGRCASIATVMFLAGDERIGSALVDPFVHNAWGMAIGDAETMSKSSEELESANKRIAKHYAEHTELTEDEALEMM